MIRVKVLGGASLSRKLRKLEAEQRKAVGGAVEASLNDLQRDARRRLRKASNSEEVAGSVFQRRKADRLGGVVGTNDRRAAELERGTPRKAARPWLKPALEAQKPKAGKRVSAAVKAANRKVAK